jgi:fucose permease
VPLRRATYSLYVLFVASGVANSTWVARFPSVRDSLGITSAAVSWILVVSAVGGLSMVATAGPAVVKYGERACHRVGTYLQLAAYGLIVAGLLWRSFALVALGAACNGAAASLVSVPQNTDAAAIERRAGHSMVPRFHGMYGFGCLAGAGASALIAQLGIPATWHYGTAAVLIWVVRMVAIRASAIGQGTVAARIRRHRKLAAAQAPAGTAAPGRTGGPARGALRAWLEKRTLAIALLVLCFTAAESGANNWMTLGVVDGLDASEAVAAGVFAAFQLSYALGRWFGAHIIDRFGRTKSLAWSAVVGTAGIVAFCLGPVVAVVAIGAVAWGAGVALAFPAAVGAVAGDPLRTPGRVSVIATVSSLSGYGVPPVIGWVSAPLGLRPVLLGLTVLLVAAFGLTRAAKHPDLPRRIMKAVHH